MKLAEASMSPASIFGHCLVSRNRRSPNVLYRPGGLFSGK